MDPWKDIGHSTRQELQELQNRKLHHFINRHLYPFSPHYQELFKKNNIDPRSIKTVADLKRIPFTSKKDFIDPDHPHKSIDFILQPDADKIKKHWPLPELLKLKALGLINGPDEVKDRLAREYRPIFITFTTGTTDKPLSYLYSKYDIDNLYVSGSRMLELFNIKNTEYIVNLFPFAPHLAFWQVVYGGLSSCALILSTGGGKSTGTDGNISAILKMKPSVVLGVPSYVYHVLRQAKEQGHKMESVKKVVLGAARVSSAFKLKLEELLASMGATDVSVFGTYGFTEARCAWAECPSSNNMSSGYHLYPDKEIFEIIDPQTGEVKGEGEDGEIVYTSIDSRGSSVIRYRTGDFAKGGITWAPCPHCKRTVPRLSSDITRISDVKDVHISKVKGSLVNFSNFSVCLSEFKEIEEWQIELCKKDNDPYEVDELIVYLTCKDSVNRSTLTETVKQRLLNMTEISPNQVVYIPIEEMVKRLELETANKEKRIIDKRPKV
ncbi:MAG: phenylacetate--CoA ligase family protein [Candidatus Omnitrophica bacterium]|nr:phenylacetate--CoA ligase family protein [Candidatus Omnitrophota bacterium]